MKKSIWQKGFSFVLTYIIGFAGFTILGAIIVIALMSLGILPTI